MKKVLCIILSLCLTFLCACGNASGGKETTVTFPTDGNSQNATSLTKAPEVTELAPPINQSTVINSEGTFTGYPISSNSMVIKGQPGGSTLSGFSALPKITFTATAPRSDMSLSKEKVSHSHGPASDGKPHHTVVEFQESFDDFSAFTLDTKSKEKVLYLTFDCGYEYENLTASVLDTLKKKQVPAAFFCTLDHIEKETEIISRMINEGHIVGNHSATHPSFADISREKIAKELEDTENYLREHYGYTSRFFRFPAGEYTEDALDQVAALGYVSVFWSVAYNDWNVDKIQGKDYAVKTVMSRLHPGAIILLHSVSKDNAAALGEIIDKARAQGYTFKALTELVR
ncbi:MAG: polysaccharide deacetylase family protein [Clostridia bacterium]|nr:polysaccharide deacetylase family protein [Clostridia bacterium]